MNTHVIVVLWNVVVMAIYGIDKWRAKNDLRRIPEKTLLICAFFMGAFGAMAGMYSFRHKTLKWKFRILVPLFCVLQIFVYAGLCGNLEEILPIIQEVWQ